MLSIPFANGIKFSLTDDAMETIIDDTINKKAICVNNLCICSIYEKGKWFAEQSLKQPDKMFPVKADLFKICLDCYNDGSMIIYRNDCKINIHYNMVKFYYERVLCNVILKEKFKDGTDFYKK